MNLLTGEFNNTLDDKGRVSIPAKLREKLPGNILHVTKGTNRCVWVFTPEEWERSYARWMQNQTYTAKRRNDILHRFIGPKQDAEIDKAGRIMIPQSLRDFAMLSKDCLVVGIGATIEIWDLEQYRMYQDSIDGDFEEILEETSSVDFYG
ncbi:MAG: division/cell wall cluster transcriptional repressor MraZ [Treponema sp.]|jgi:MraZ protein|nr:division/cell wall cluster transcriptional repressor MraZ [Treponema sp.]